MYLANMQVPSQRKKKKKTVTTGRAHKTHFLTNILLQTKRQKKK